MSKATAVGVVDVSTRIGNSATKQGHLDAGGDYAYSSLPCRPFADDTQSLLQRVP